jgi:hypothetical protein
MSHTGGQQMCRLLFDDSKVKLSVRVKRRMGGGNESFDAIFAHSVTAKNVGKFAIAPLLSLFYFRTG